jgi:hypothetical protein
VNTIIFRVVLLPVIAAYAMVFGSVTAMAATIYDNTTTQTNVWAFGGAVDVNGTTFTNLDINQLNLAPGSAGDQIDSITFLAYHGSPSTITTGATIDIWASNAAGTGPGSLLGSYSIASQSLISQTVTPLTASIPLGTLITPSNDTIWAGIYFDTPTTSTSVDQLNSLGALSYHPATIGTDGPTAYFTPPTNPLAYNVDNPRTIAFGGTDGANYGWTVDAVGPATPPVPIPASAWLMLSGLGGLGLLVRKKRPA